MLENVYANAMACVREGGGLKSFYRCSFKKFHIVCHTMPQTCASSWCRSIAARRRFFCPIDSEGHFCPIALAEPCRVQCLGRSEGPKWAAPFPLKSGSWVCRQERSFHNFVQALFAYPVPPPSLKSLFSIQNRCRVFCGKRLGLECASKRETLKWNVSEMLPLPLSLGLSVLIFVPALSLA